MSSEAPNPDVASSIEMSTDREPVPPGETTERAEEVLAQRLDRLEVVLRQELTAQKARADRAEAQLRALGDLDERADELVSTARAQATRLLENARHEREAAVAEHTESSAALEAARKEAAELVRRAQVTSPGVSTGAPVTGPLDEELLTALRDHLIDMGALQSEIVTETRKAVIKLVQAASQARGAAALRPVPSVNSSGSVQERARS